MIAVTPRLLLGTILFFIHHNFMILPISDFGYTAYA